MCTCLPISSQECLLINWAHWLGASSTMLKQPTTTYAGERRSCTIKCDVNYWATNQSGEILNGYLICASIQSDAPFEGAYGNLKRLFDKAAKMYHQVKKQEMKKLSPSRQRWGGFTGFQRVRKLCTHVIISYFQSKNSAVSVVKQLLNSRSSYCMTTHFSACRYRFICKLKCADFLFTVEQCSLSDIN